MFDKAQMVYEETKQADFQIWHFLTRLIMFFGLSISILIIVFVFFLIFYSGYWLSDVSQLELALIIFSIYTIDITIILLMLKSRYKYPRKQMKFGKCKSYLWIGIMFVFIYMALVPLTIESF